MRFLWKALPFLLLFAALKAQGDFEKGLSYYKQGQYDKAIAEFEQLVEASPDYEDGFRILGDCYLRTKRFEQAVTAFEKAISLKDDNLASYLGLGSAQYRNGSYDAAIATLLKAERHARASRARLQLYKIRGSAYFNSGRYQDALKDLEQARSIRRGDAKVLLQIGLANYRLGNRREAAQALEQVLALDPNDRQARTFLSQIKYQDGLAAISEADFNKAVGLLKEFLAGNSRDGEAWFNLGLAQQALEDYAGAEVSYRESAKYLSGKWEVHDRLGFVYEMRQKFDLALASYQTAFDLSKKNEVEASVKRVKERIKRQKQGI